MEPNLQKKIINKVKSIINHEDFNSPYDWINDDHASADIENLLNSTDLDKKATINSLIKSYYENYKERLERLMPLDPPPIVLLGQSEGYLDCLKRLNQILENNN